LGFPPASRLRHSPGCLLSKLSFAKNFPVAGSCNDPVEPYLHAHAFQEVPYMNRIPTIGLSLLLGSLLAGAALSTPGANAKQDREARDQAVGLESLSGRITSINGNTFTVESERRQTQNARTDPTSAMTFMLDQNTTVDGKLEIGANANVTFREENGNNIAVSVRVTARS
jgi:hypothetical protein